LSDRYQTTLRIRNFCVCLYHLILGIVVATRRQLTTKVAIRSCANPFYLIFPTTIAAGLLNKKGNFLRKPPTYTHSNGWRF